MRTYPQTQTALMVAAHNGDLEVVKTLVVAGCNKDCVNDKVPTELPCEPPSINSTSGDRS